MKKVLFIGLLLIGCTKPKPEEQTKNTYVFMGFRNYTTMSLNYADGCEANIVQTGVTKFLTSGTDTICSFKVDGAGVISWKTRQGHLVTLGGCNVNSLTISQ